MGKRKQQAPRRNHDHDISTTNCEPNLNGHALPSAKRRCIEVDDDVSTVDESTMPHTIEAEDVLSVSDILNKLFTDDESNLVTKIKVNNRGFIHGLMHHVFSSDTNDDKTNDMRTDDNTCDDVVVSMNMDERISSLLSAVLDFGMLDLFLLRCDSNGNPNSSASVFKNTQRCVFRCLMKSNVCSSVDKEGAADIYLLIYLTTQAYQQSTPLELGGNLIGSKQVLSKKPSLHAALSLRNALGSLYPQSVIGGVCSNPSGIGSPPIQARFIYNLVDNVQFNRVHIETEEANHNVICKIDGLRPTLRMYQAHAVQWMLSRENGIDIDDLAWEVCWVAIEVTNTSTPILSLTKYRDIYSNIGLRRAILFNPFTGWLCSNIDEAKESTIGSNYPGVKGGILAESMGLGKTVEMLACLLSNPRPLKDVNIACIRSALIEENEVSGLPESIAEAKRSDEVEIAWDGKQTIDSLNDDTVNIQIGMIVHVNRNKIKGRNIEGGIAKIVKVTPDPGFDFVYDVKYIIGGGMVKAISKDMFELSKNNRIDTNRVLPSHDDVCVICTKARKKAYGWVRCNKCYGQLHSVCAGYCTDEDIPVTRICSFLRCPCCAAQEYFKNPIRSRATLIVTPPAILEQWARELQRHCFKQMKVLIYPGVQTISNKTKLSDSTLPLLVHPHELADADVVLTTFSVLNTELAHCDNEYVLNSGNKKDFRSKKKYRVLPSPLNSIEWWRVCLDEAQRVEGTATAAAKMALRLQTINKWCITGTPIGRGKLDDLFGLLLFLGIMPFRERYFFRHCFHSSIPGFSDRIRSMLQSIFWRSTKIHPSIREQLGIPEQVEKKMLLDFSTIEKHFYKKQLVSIVNVLNEASTLNKQSQVEALSSRLHSLRAACCHPQVGSHGIHRLGPKSSQTSLERVLTMSQILDKLIEDARLKCEESQRIAVLHTNALACITKLKCELKEREPNPIPIPESNRELLEKSANLYLEAHELIENNAKATKVVSELSITGCTSLMQQSSYIRSGTVTLEWKIRCEKDVDVVPVWAKLDFMSVVKISSFKIRVNDSFHRVGSDEILIPNECVLQASNASLGGEFVDVQPFKFENDNSLSLQWKVLDGIRTTKSKSWRIFIKNYYASRKKSQGYTQSFASLTIEIQMMEPSIGADDLQRLHILHNLSCVDDLLFQLDSSVSKEPNNNNKLRKCKVDSELKHLEANYLGLAKAYHAAAREVLLDVSAKKSDLIQTISQLSKGGDKHSWWRDLLSRIHLSQESFASSHSIDQLCNTIKSEIYEENEQIDGSASLVFQHFDGTSGLHAVLELKGSEICPDHSSISKVLSLTDSPTDAEILENSYCHKCRADWYQTGPKCRHCKLEESLLRYEDNFDKKPLNTALKCIYRWLGDLRSKSKRPSDRSFLLNIEKRGDAYFKLVDLEKRELYAAKRYWRTHFDLLSSYDELNSCKSTMRLLGTKENISNIPKSQLASIVIPSDIPGLLMDHTARQAGALAALRRDIASLRYLRNQSMERAESSEDTGKDKPFCPVCLMEFNIDDRAVLKCGHSLHTVCLEEIIKRSGSSKSIKCPMKCSHKTHQKEVLIATESLSKYDGSKVSREIIGSWGTKVDRLVSDLIEVTGNGERCLVFSQWDDLLSIVETALSANNIPYTHPKSAKTFGESVHALRTSCPVMLLNVKNGAEGLTLVEATHVFMVEPLLHCGLDSQAINRVHRIGQTSKTYVHRYIIKNTIEEKIDEMRMERQATFESHGDEESVSVSKRVAEGKIQAGGLDGSFTPHELRDVLNTF